MTMTIFRHELGQILLSQKNVQCSRVESMYECNALARRLINNPNRNQLSLTTTQL